ncbi:hypothetical protein CR513_55405, partial [Mucuna pruriens]
MATESLIQLTIPRFNELEALQLKVLKSKNYFFQAIDHPILETILSKDTIANLGLYENEVPRFGKNKEATTSITSPRFRATSNEVWRINF